MDNKKKKSKIAKANIGVHLETKLRVDELKGKSFNDDYINFLADVVEDFSEKLNGRLKVEFFVKNMLIRKMYENKITATMLRNVCGVNFNTCKDVVCLLEAEINEYNKNVK